MSAHLNFFVRIFLGELAELSATVRTQRKELGDILAVEASKHWDKQDEDHYEDSNPVNDSWVGGYRSQEVWVEWYKQRQFEV